MSWVVIFSWWESNPRPAWVLGMRFNHWVGLVGWLECCWGWNPNETNPGMSLALFWLLSSVSRSLWDLFPLSQTAKTDDDDDDEKKIFLFVAGGGTRSICLLRFPGRDREKKKKKRGGGCWLTGWLLLLCLFAVYWHWVARKEGREEAGVGFVSLVPRFLEMVWERQRCSAELFEEEFGGWVFGWRVFVGFETVGRIRTGVLWDWVLGWRTWGGGEEEAGRRRRGSRELHMKGLEKGQKSVEEEEEETRSLFLLWVNCGVVMRLARSCCFGDHPSSRTRWWSPLPLMKKLCQETAAAVAVFCCKGALSGG